MSIRRSIARRTQYNFRLNRKVIHLKHCWEDVNSMLDTFCGHKHKPAPPPKPPKPQPKPGPPLCPPPCFPCCPFCMPPKPGSAPVCLQNHRDHLRGHRTACLRNRRVLLRDHPSVRLRNHRDPQDPSRDRSPVRSRNHHSLQDLNRDLLHVPLRNHRNLSPDRHTVRHLVVPVQNAVRFSRRFGFNTVPKSVVDSVYKIKIQAVFRSRKSAPTFFRQIRQVGRI